MDINDLYRAYRQEMIEGYVSFDVDDKDVYKVLKWDTAKMGTLPESFQGLLNKKLNEPIYEKLAALDAKSIRALREGDSTRLAALEAQAESLRQGLK